MKATVISIISLLARKQHTEPNNRVPPANLSGGTLFSNRPVSQSNSGNKTSSDAFRRRAIQSLTVLLAVVTLCFLALCLGCRTATTKGKPKQAGTYDPIVLQQQLMRLSDDFSGHLTAAIDTWAASSNAPDRAALLRLKVDTVGQILSVATGPNELMNLGDMLVVVTLTRAAAEQKWATGAYSQSALPILRACQQAETNLEKIALSVVTPQQLDELRAAVGQLRKNNPDLRSAVFARGLGLGAGITLPTKQAEAAPGSFFSLLGLDPLASLEPAVRELTQNRLLAERGIFIAQRLPTWLRWQAELLVLETTETPAALDARHDIRLIAEALERTSKTAQGFPALVRSEREAIFNALPEHAAMLTNVAAQLTMTIEAGTRMSESLNATLQSYTLFKQEAAAEAAQRAARGGPPPEPLRLKDYTETAKQVEIVTREMTELLKALNQTVESTNLARISVKNIPLMQQAEAGGRAVADYALRRAILLVGITCFAGIVTTLLLRWLLRQKASA